MKKAFMKTVSLIIGVIMLTAFILPTSAAAVTQITLNKANVAVNVGETSTLTATLTGGTATVVWTSSNTGVATVVNGVITGVGAGTATITASAGTCTASATVKVTDFSSKAWGVDVSKYQGNIDWVKLKQSGIDFAIIRVGYGIRTSGSITIDPYFYQNIEGARNAGIDIGVYLYSYAQTVAAAQSEAAQVISILNNYQGYLTYPVWYDFEDSGCASTSRKSLNAQIILAFCNALENAGYYSGIYSYTSYINSYIDDSQLTSLDHWIAQYGVNDGYPHSCTYSGSYGMWQYTSQGQGRVLAGSVQGSGLDLNYAYKNYPKIIINAGLNKFDTGSSSGSSTDYEWTISGDNLYDRMLSVRDGWSNQCSASNYFDYFSAAYPRSGESRTSCLPQQRYATGVISYLWGNQSFAGTSSSFYQTAVSTYKLPTLNYTTVNGKFYYYFNSGSGVGTASARNDAGFVVTAGAYNFYRQEALDDTLGNITADNVKRVFGGKGIPGSVILAQKNGGYNDSLDIMIIEKVTADGVYVTYQHTTAGSDTNYSYQCNSQYTQIHKNEFISYANLASTYSRHLELLFYFTPDVVYNQTAGYYVPASFTESGMVTTVYNVTMGQAFTTDQANISTRFCTTDDNLVTSGNMYAQSSDTSVVGSVSLSSDGKTSTAARIRASITPIGCGTAVITFKSAGNGNIQQFTVNVKPYVTAINQLTVGQSTELDVSTGDKAVSWTTSNASVAKIENGNLVGVGTGSAVITATSGGQSTSFTVNVTA